MKTKTYNTFQFPPMNKLKKSLLRAKHSATEVKDIIEGLKELPEYK